MSDRSAELEAIQLSRPCSTCGAQPGEACYRLVQRLDLETHEAVCYPEKTGPAKVHPHRSRGWGDRTP